MTLPNLANKHKTGVWAPSATSISLGKHTAEYWNNLEYWTSHGPFLFKQIGNAGQLNVEASTGVKDLVIDCSGHILSGVLDGFQATMRISFS